MIDRPQAASGRDVQTAPPDYDAIIALGSNIGDKAANIRDAVSRLTAQGTGVEAVKFSRIFKTPPWGITDQDWFTNACLTVRTHLDPHELLDVCLDVERQLGRERKQKWGPRVIDLDVLIYGDQIIESDTLTIPHPHMSERAFVLIPLRDVAPEQLINEKPIDHWLAKLDTSGIEPL